MGFSREENDLFHWLDMNSDAFVTKDEVWKKVCSSVMCNYFCEMTVLQNFFISRYKRFRCNCAAMCGLLMLQGPFLFCSARVYTVYIYISLTHHQYIPFGSFFIFFSCAQSTRILGICKYTYIYIGMYVCMYVFLWEVNEYIRFDVF
jgi:hypothetical protein